MKLTHILPLVAFLGLAAAFGVSLVRDPPKANALAEMRPLPAFDLPPIAPGRPGLANGDLQGEVAMVHVFASWCPSCAVEHPTLEAIAATGLAPVYGVAWLDKPGAAAAWLDRYGDLYRATGEDADGRLGVDLGVTGTPETFIIDKKGRIRFHQVGPITAEIWERDLAPLIADLQREPAV